MLYIQWHIQLTPGTKLDQCFHFITGKTEGQSGEPRGRVIHVPLNAGLLQCNPIVVSVILPLTTFRLCNDESSGRLGGCRKTTHEKTQHRNRNINVKN